MAGVYDDNDEDGDDGDDDGGSGCGEGCGAGCDRVGAGWSEVHQSIS